MNLPIETHPLKPFIPTNSRVLMLGSFPPPCNKWKMNFYYPNFQNDMWRILGIVFFNDSEYFIDTANKNFNEAKIHYFLNQTGIAISDTAYRIQRLQGNAADQFLKIIEPMPIIELLSQMPNCHDIITTGSKATDTLLELLNDTHQPPKVGETIQLSIHQRHINLHRLPSSSRAYPLALNKKASAYYSTFKKIRLIK